MFREFRCLHIRCVGIKWKGPNIAKIQWEWWGVPMSWCSGSPSVTFDPTKTENLLLASGLSWMGLCVSFFSDPWIRTTNRLGTCATQVQQSATEFLTALDSSGHESQSFLTCNFVVGILVSKLTLNDLVSRRHCGVPNETPHNRVQNVPKLRWSTCVPTALNLMSDSVSLSQDPGSNARTSVGTWVSGTIQYCFQPFCLPNPNWACSIRQPHNPLCKLFFNSQPRNNTHNQLDMSPESTAAARLCPPQPHKQKPLDAYHLLNTNTKGPLTLLSPLARFSAARQSDVSDNCVLAVFELQTRYCRTRMEIVRVSAAWLGLSSTRRHCCLAIPHSGGRFTAAWLKNHYCKTAHLEFCKTFPYKQKLDLWIHPTD